MNEERRREDRYPVQRPAVLRLQGRDSEAVCTSISAGGGFMRCDMAAELGQVVEVSIQPRRASRPDIVLSGTVVFIAKSGGPERKGLGLRWGPQDDPKPLQMLLTWAANMAAQGLTDDPTASRETLLENRVDPETLEMPAEKLQA